MLCSNGPRGSNAKGRRIITLVSISGSTLPSRRVANETFHLGQAAPLRLSSPVASMLPGLGQEFSAAGVHAGRIA